MIDKRTWKEFKDSGLLWWINTLLHTFGWSIVLLIDENDSIVDVYPARVKFRGFDEKTNKDGYIKISKYINNNSKELLKESKS